MKEHKYIYLSSPHMSEENFEQEFIASAFESNWIAPVGENVLGFEKELGELIDKREVLAVSSGTAAIHLAVKAAGVQRGDLVLCQSFTFVASVNPVLYEGGIPIFIDSDQETWGMDPVLLEQALKKYPQAKAVIIAHIYGIPAQIEELRRICQKYSVPLIEDAAEAFGSLYKKKMVGTFGDYGIYSFNGNKIITTSAGGALTAADPRKLAKARFWSKQSKEERLFYEHEELGYNYGLSNISAGIGRGQLMVIGERIKKKYEIYRYYQEAFAAIPSLEVKKMPKHTKANYWLTCIMLSEEISPVHVMNHLESLQIESRRLWKPMHLQPLYQHCEVFGGQVAHECFRRGLSLPSDTKMNESDLARVVAAVKEALKQ